jgi:gluconate 2-dehydrogenase gamma chain
LARPSAQHSLINRATSADFAGGFYGGRHNCAPQFLERRRCCGHTDCGLVTFWDRQLAGAYGNGGRLYRNGPFVQGKPEQGYQLPLTPREYFGAGIKAANFWSRKSYGKEFDRLSPAERDVALKAMDGGQAKFEGMNAKRFFEALYASAMEGFFSDPLHGGNRGKASWKMIGYPGLPATYARTAEQYRGKKVNLEPKSIQDFI